MLRFPDILLVDPPPPLPAPIPRIARANSGILLAGLHSPGATGALAETRILSGMISTNIRARHGLTVRPREKSYFANSA
jgi:hypothetical protein